MPIRNCTEDRLKELIENIDPNIKYEENNINKAIHNCYKNFVLRHTENLIAFHSIMHVELLRILINIKAPAIMLNMMIIENSNENNFKDLEENLIKLHTYFKELALFKECFIESQYPETQTA